MKYLFKTPFASKPATEKYRDGWDAIFGPKAPEPEAPLPHDRTAELAALFADLDKEPDCNSCFYLCQEENAADFYCMAVNAPWGQTLQELVDGRLVSHRPNECGESFKLYKIRPKTESEGA